MSQPQFTLTQPITKISNGQRILSITLPYLQTDRIIRAASGKSWRLETHHNTHGLSQTSIAIIDSIKNAIRIVALDENSKKSGLHINQTLSDARALFPNLQCVQRDQTADDNLLRSIADWCQRYTPLVACEEHGNIFLDITGCAHLFGGEHAMVQDLGHRLKAQGFDARIAIANTPGAAWALSRYSPDPQTVTLQGDASPLLETLPLEALRLGKTTVSSIKRMGLKTIGCIADLPRAPMAARFGAEVLLRLDQALGRQQEAISPDLYVPELSSERVFNEPITLQEDIERTILNLAENLKPSLERQAKGARKLALKLFRIDGECLCLNVHASSAVRDPDHILRLFSERIMGLHNALDAGFGFDLLRLDVVQAEPFETTQTDLIKGKNPDDCLSALIDRLGARIGTDRIESFVEADTHIPERCFATQPFILKTRKSNEPSGFARSATRHDETITTQDAPLTRPLLLLKNPERVEVVADVPEGPPARFRWRKVLYQVERSEGPERIAAQWWQDGRAAHSRDYFRVEDDTGHRFWLFRHGLYERETNMPKWYMHGLFG